jgi:hypothetical protein
LATPRGTNRGSQGNGQNEETKEGQSSYIQDHGGPSCDTNGQASGIDWNDSCLDGYIAFVVIINNIINIIGTLKR